MSKELAKTYDPHGMEEISQDSSTWDMRSTILCRIF